MRLDKYLADAGLGTRSELKKAIKAGQVMVDGAATRDPGMHIGTDSAVLFRGEPVSYEEFVYYMLNKPAGIISASNDPREETVIDLITETKPRDLFPAGRLDRDTEGLMLITNDGALAHRLLSPRHHVSKVYFAHVRDRITEDDIALFRSGMTLPDGLECLPAELEITGGPEDSGSGSDGSRLSPSTEVIVTIHEGKFHQIKRMFQAIGSEVIYLKRLSMGPLKLDPSLAPGEYRRLTDEETAMLRGI